MKLNLGCSDDLKPGFVNVDIGPDPQVYYNCRKYEYQQADLNQLWLWEDSSVDEIYAHDVFEHFADCQHVGKQICSVCYRPRRGDASGCRICGMMPCYENKLYCRLRNPKGKMHAMNEAHRVLKPGGILDLAVPCVMLTDGRVNPGAFADPTHASYWTPDDIFYFGEQFNTPAFERGRLGAAYGITALFRHPPMIEMDGEWFASTGGKLKWEIQGYGKGAARRSKIMAILEAVKP